MRYISKTTFLILFFDLLDRKRRKFYIDIAIFSKGVFLVFRDIIPTNTFEITILENSEKNTMKSPNHFFRCILAF